MAAGMTRAARKRRPFRTLVLAVLTLALLLVLLLLGVGLLAQSRLDQDGLKLRIQRAVLRQTGRTLALGALHVRLLPVPTLEAETVALANWPDHGPPQMLTAAGVSAHVALLPLLDHVVRLEGLTLTRPDLVLQRDPDGRANWQMHRQEQPTGGGSSGNGGAHWRLEVGSIRLRDGTLAWQDGLKGWTGAAALNRLESSGLAGDRPAITVAGSHGGSAFDAEIRTGALARLAMPAGAPWPIRLVARQQADGREAARLAVDGTLTDPARARGYALDVTAQAAHLDTLNRLFPHARLPAANAVSLHTRLVDGGAADAAHGRPELGALSLRTGSFPAGTVLRSRWLRDLSVTSLSLDAATGDAPLSVALDGRWHGQATSLRGTAGTLSAWQADPGGTLKPVPVSLQLSVADARAQIDGTAGPAASNLLVALKAPVLRRVLDAGPALHDVVLSARLQRQGDVDYAVTDLHLDSRELGATGSAILHAAPHPNLTATLAVPHADLDALRAELADIVQAPGSGPGPGSAAAPPPPLSAPAGASQGHVVPFAALRLADLAIRLDAQDIRLGGVRYHDLGAQLSVRDGNLALAPFSVSGPAGPIAGRLEADGAAQSVRLVLEPSMVPAETLAALAGRPPVLSGTVELVGDLHAQGGTTEAWMASMAGQAGASLVNGSIANSVLSQLAGRTAGLPEGGRTALRCLAVPAHVTDGVATLASLALQTGRLDLQGHGTVRLADGRLDLHLLPRVSIGIGGASLPVRVGGTLDSPEAALDAAAPGGRFALTIGPGGPAPDLCGPALGAARFGAPGPQPGPMAPDRPRKLPKPIDILRGLGLFR